MVGGRPRRSSPRAPHRARGRAGRPGGGLSPHRSAGSSSSAIGLPGEENRGLAQDLALFPQIPDLTTQLSKLVAFSGGQPVGAAASVKIRLLHPLADRGLGQVQLSGDLTGRLAGAADQLNDFSLVLRREESSGAWHRTPISRAAPSSWVSTKPGQLQIGAVGGPGKRLDGVAE